MAGETKEWQEEFADIDVHAYSFESKNPFVNWIHNKRHYLTLELIKKENPKKILEIGSGDGYFAEKLFALKKENNLKFEVTGIEIAEKRIERSIKKVPEGKFIQGDVVDLPFKDKSFDLVIASEVLEHIPKYRQAMKEIKRVLSPNGALIITFPNETNWRLGRLCMLRFPIAFPDHVNSLKPNEFIEFYGKPEEKFSLPFKRAPFSFALTFLMKFRKKNE